MDSTSAIPNPYPANSVEAILLRLAVVADSILAHRPEGLGYAASSQLARSLVSEGLEGLTGQDRIIYSQLANQFFDQWAELEKGRLP